MNIPSDMKVPWFIKKVFQGSFGTHSRSNSTDSTASTNSQQHNITATGDQQNKQKNNSHLTYSTASTRGEPQNQMLVDPAANQEASQYSCPVTHFIGSLFRLHNLAEFDMLAETVLADRRDRLEQLVLNTYNKTQDELSIALSFAKIVSSSQMDELARVFITLLDSKQLLTSFLQNMFYKEVENSDCMQTLFRGNSLASRVMSHCFRIFGANYLKALLGPHIEPLTFESALASNTSNISYEIDSARLVENDADIEKNRRNLSTLTEQVLYSILTSASKFPPQLKSMCICLHQVLCKKYPHATNNLIAVGTVIFLRFINPAIVSPYESGIVEKQPSQKNLRGLMLVSKILQNIANNVEFGKEGHMLPFNDFVRNHFEPLREWVSEIITGKLVES